MIQSRMRTGTKMIFMMMLLTVAQLVDGCIKAKFTIIGHRGGLNGPVPQHSVAAYSLGADMGADFLEPDLVFSKDGVFFSFHELELSSSTDISKRSEFAEYKKSKNVLEPNGVRNLTGWFADDLTSVEIKTLNLVSKKMADSVANGPVDSQFLPVTFSEMIDLVGHLSRIYARSIGIYPELKNPTYFRQKGLKPEETLLDTLAEKGWVSKVIGVGNSVFYENQKFSGGKSLLIIQSFDVDSLQRLANMTDVPLVQLMMDNKTLVREGKRGVGVPSYSKEGIAKIASYASGIGSYFVDALDDKLKAVKLAKKYDLFVHAYTLERELEHYELLAELNVDGIFTDDVSIARIFNEQVEVCDSQYYTKIFGVVLVSFLWCLPFIWLIFLQITSAKKKKEKRRMKMQMKNAPTTEIVPMLDRNGDEQGDDDLSK